VEGFHAVEKLNADVGRAGWQADRDNLARRGLPAAAPK